MKFETTHLLHFSDLVEDLIENNLTLRINTRGGSMYPQIMSGDVVLISPIHDNSLKKGKIVVYRSGSAFVCHRIVKTYQKDKLFLCQTRGDSHVINDPEFPCENVLGIVNSIEMKNFGILRKILFCVSNLLLKFGVVHGVIFSGYLSIRGRIGGQA
jgi:signal peptidase I